MISVQKALQHIQDVPVQPQPIKRALTDALGHYLAEKIEAPFDVPDFDNSAMDGYAVCGHRTTYRITGEIAAGYTENLQLHDGEAVRIFTGAKIPAHTTAVIMQEKTTVSDGLLYIQETVITHKNIRPKGGELKKGQAVFEPGQWLNAASMAMLGTLGKTAIRVFQKPVIRLITTGNELVAPGSSRKAGQIYESNSIALTAALQQYGFTCAGKKQMTDDYQHISAGIREDLGQSDVLILSGGISVGDYDYVKAALEENGVQQIFYKVDQKPGKPLYFGRKGQTFVFALPGNPAASLTCFYVYVLPLLQRLSGAQHAFGLTRLSLPLAHLYKKTIDRPVFLKASIQQQQVILLDGQMSSMMHSMALGNALAFITKPGHYHPGDTIECMLITV